MGERGGKSQDRTQEISQDQAEETGEGKTKEVHRDKTEEINLDTTSQDRSQKKKQNQTEKITQDKGEESRQDTRDNSRHGRADKPRKDSGDESGREARRATKAASSQNANGRTEQKPCPQTNAPLAGGSPPPDATKFAQKKKRVVFSMRTGPYDTKKYHTMPYGRPAQQHSNKKIATHSMALHVYTLHKSYAGVTLKHTRRRQLWALSYIHLLELPRYRNSSTAKSRRQAIGHRSKLPSPHISVSVLLFCCFCCLHAFRYSRHYYTVPDTW